MGTTPRSVMRCHVLSWLSPAGVMKCHVLHARSSYAVVDSGMKLSGCRSVPLLAGKPGRAPSRWAPAFRPASPPVRGGGRLRSSSLFPRRGAGPFTARILLGRGRVSAPARFARLIARARQRAHVSRWLLTGFQKSAPLGRATPGEATPDSASLGTIIPHSARCQAHTGNKIHKYQKLFMCREIRRN